VVCIPVAGPTQAYNIHIAALDDLPSRWARPARCVIVTNSTLLPLYGDHLRALLPGTPILIMPDGEQHKTLATVAHLYAGFIQSGLDRGGAVIAFGGGVVGDTAGFAAATYMRGVSLAQIPTTLLSMVDSSVGGKVGIDLPQGKNLVGAFKDPDVVLIDPALLATLPDVERRCGLAEVIKHGLIANAFPLDSLLDPHPHWASLIARAVQVKVDVVQHDPYEKGIRAYLNLGHTFGHAIEQVSGYAWRHGEAVAVGLLAAARLSRDLKLCGAELVDQVDHVLAAVGLPRSIGALDAEAIYKAMATDKKWRAGRSRFVLLRAIGQPEIVEGVPPEAVMSVLEGLRS
jgi:3-dehydroquinate synthase